MNLINELKGVIKTILKDLERAGALPKSALDAQFTVEPPRDPDHGDLATNVALVLAKPAGRNPRELADAIAEHLRARDSITEAEVAGPGFINMRLTPDFWRGLIPEILGAGTSYGDSDIGAKTPINVEYVSANPTGPLHIGHVRGAVFGDALANLLAKAGYEVTKEYYTNDAGVQIDTLARSVHYRYLQALGRVTKPIPEGLYPGDYLVPVGEALAKKFGEKYADTSESDWLDIFRLESTTAMMDLVRADLAALGIHHDVFFSERSIHASGEIDKALDMMEEAGNLYVGVLEPPKGKVPEDWEPRPQTLFRATKFGDDVDRPIKKSDGSYTYFAADIAYHYDKIRRGFLNQIDVLGADHGGYVKRLKAVVSALSDGKGELDVRLCQMVRLTRGGKPVKMSKRAGSFVTVSDVVDEVGPDVIRFMMLTRRNDAQLDFDFEKVTEQSRENPVFYVQYAHARIRSVLRKADEQWGGKGPSDEALAKADLSGLDSPHELSLIRMLALWPQTVEGAAMAHEPHRIAFYLYDLAAEFHTLWNRGNEDPAMRFLIDDDKALSLARLALIEATRLVIASGLQILGVTPVEEMH